MKNPIVLFVILLTMTVTVYSQPNFPDNGQVYRNDVVPRVDITISEDTLQWIYDNVDSDKEFKAAFVYSAGGNIDTFPEIGFRLRGNTSRYSAKKSFKVSFNTYTPGANFNGIEKMNLNGEHNDPSIIRSYLSWNFFRQMQVPGSRSNHVDVYINNQYYGLYINVEHVDEVFVKSRFGNSLGNLYKCLSPANLTYLGTSKEVYKANGYDLKTNTDEDDYSDLINFLYILNNTSPEDFPTELEPIFNVNGFLRYLAVEIFAGHWDAYSFNMNNYYLFNNWYTHKFEFIPYDVDNTYGIDWYNIDWANRDIYQWWNTGEARPLTSKIFENQVYRDRFSFFINQLVDQYGNSSILFPQIDDIKLKIDASAEADVYRTLDYGWTIADYNNSYTQALGAHVKYGLKPYIDIRIASLEQQLELNSIAPIIENVYHNFPQINQSVSVTSNITDDQPNPTGKLYYRFNDGPEQIISLTKNSDQKYVAVIPANPIPGIIKFYIMATDADENTTREPYSGEYTINNGLVNSSLMITEYMSGNMSTIVDSYGGYEDWIEIKNTGEEEVSLNGKYLSDDLNNPSKFKLPDVHLAANQYYLVWADEDGNQGFNHANFKLSSSGESIGLFDSYETNFASIYALDYTAQDADNSSGINNSGNIVPQAYITPMGDNGSTDVAFATFKFDMNDEIADGRFFPVSDFIDVAGTFNDWLGDVPVFDGNEDGIYQYTTFGLISGEEIQYKARINANWGTAEFPELGGEGNRIYTLLSGHNIISHLYNNTDITETLTAESDTELDIQIYPNPSPSGFFNVKTGFTIETIRIYSMTGNLLYRNEKVNENQLSMNVALNPGIYLIKISGNYHEFTARVSVY